MRNVLQIIGLVIAMTLSFSNPALASNKTPLEQAELYYSWVKDSAETNWSESILKLIKKRGGHLGAAFLYGATTKSCYP